VARAGVTDAQAVEKIDIGGPAMIRAAAKNHRHVVVVTDPARYPEVAAALETSGGAVPRGLARELAGEAFRRTAAYDGAIGAWFGRAPDEAPAGSMPDRLTLELDKIEDLATARIRISRPRSTARPASRQGWPPSAACTARRCRTSTIRPRPGAPPGDGIRRPRGGGDQACHPLRRGLGPDTLGAFQRAWAADPLSGFGGIVGLNRPCDEATAAVMSESFLELVAAPTFTPEALALLKKRRISGSSSAAGSCRLRRRWSFRCGRCSAPGSGSRPTRAACRPVRGRDPSGADRRRAGGAADRLADLQARQVERDRPGERHGSVGLGGGQTSRVDAVEDSIRKAARGVGIGRTVMASDASFPSATASTRPTPPASGP